MPSGFLRTDQPIVTDAKSCEAWLARAALADPRQACRELTGLIESLEETPDGAALDIVERLREPIFVAQTEHAKRFSMHPQPLQDFEVAAFEQVCDLWTALASVYRRLLGSAVEDRSRTPTERMAMLAQRALDSVAELMLAHYRARREIDNEVWRDLHRLYQTADQQGIALQTVPAGYRSKSVSTCAEVYVRALLLALANPYGHTLRELGWTRRWAAMWAYKVDLLPAAENLLGYVVDLAGSAPPAWANTVSAMPALRVLEMSNLRRSVLSRVKKLESGVDPQTLSLGKDCVQPDVGRLLTQLARAWVETPVQRQFSRHAGADRIELTSGIEPIHAAVSGRPFKSAVRHWDYSRRDAEQIHIHQGVAAAAAPGEGASGVPTEKWETLDESATGFRLRRNGVGARLSLGQLVALRPQNARAFILSDVRWLMTGIDGSLLIGAAALPGLAKGVAVRPASTAKGAPEPYARAFLLRGSGPQPVSIVLPSGWYQPERELELRDEEEALTRVKLAGLVQRGYDYDRAMFSVSGAASA